MPSSSASADVGLDDLDRRHAERARRLQVRADVVEEDGVRRPDAEARRSARSKMRGSGFRMPSTADSTYDVEERARATPARPSSVTQLLVIARGDEARARMRRIASSIAGRGAVAAATRSISARAPMVRSRPARSRARTPGRTARASSSPRSSRDQAPARARCRRRHG